MRRDWERAGQIGLTRFLIVLTWQDFQPDRQRVSVARLRDLEAALRIADDLQVHIIPALFAARVDGMLQIPSWALLPEPGRDWWGAASNLFTRQETREAEDLLLREVVGEFGRHPAVGGWVLGDRLAEEAQGEGTGAYAEWLGAVVELTTRLGVVQPIMNGASVRAVADASVPFDQFGSLGVQPLVHDDWMPAWAADRQAWGRVLTGAVARLAGPPVIASIGRRTNELGFVATSEPANDADVMLQAIAESGGAVSLAADLFDPDEDLRRLMPYSYDPRLLSGGLMRGDGSLKDTGRVWAEWARADVAIQPVPDQFPAIDPDEWRRRPEAILREIYEEFGR